MEEYLAKKNLYSRWFYVLCNVSVQLNHQHLYSIHLTRTVLPTRLFVDRFNMSNTLASICGRCCGGRRYKTQILLNAFSTWCTWSKMTVIVDKCHTFDIMKKNTTSTQTKPKLYFNNEVITPIKDDESFKYLGR